MRAVHPTDTARVAGVFYLLNGAAGLFGYMIAPRLLIVQGDATSTASNILASETLFRVGIVSELISAVAFILLAIALYRLFSGVNKTQASLLAAFILVAAPVMFLNALNELAALALLHGADFLSPLQGAQQNALAMLFLELHRQGVVVVTMLWGLWLLPFGLLVYRSGFLPRIIGVFLILACFAYVTTSLVYLLLPSLGNLVTLIAILPEALGEGSTIGWLLVKGAKPGQTNASGLRSIASTRLT